MPLDQRECAIGAQNGKRSNSTKSTKNVGANGGAIGAINPAAHGSNGSSVGANGGANGPVVPQVQVKHAERKGVHTARSTDLIFLKSVVTTNTEAQPKKVSVKRRYLRDSILKVILTVQPLLKIKNPKPTLFLSLGLVSSYA